MTLSDWKSPIAAQMASRVRDALRRERLALIDERGLSGGGEYLQRETAAA
jgi:hypothetical protein